jgi:hypothetical protein
MVMFEQSRRLSEPLRFGRREKALLAVLVSITVLALAGLLVSGLTSSGGIAARDGCVDVNFPSTLGGAELKGCGSQARRICANGGDFKHIEAELKAACRKAGYAFSS